MTITMVQMRRRMCVASCIQYKASAVQPRVKALNQNIPDCEQAHMKMILIRHNNRR